MFYIYMHTFKSSNKSYIGYTSKTVSERLQKHYQNALAGIDTHFYRAIRKYGVGDIETQILWKGDSFTTAKKQEIKFIEMYKTLKEGYNMTYGGDGGWCVPPEKYEEWKEHLSMSREKNGRWSGYSDDEILDCAHDYFKSNEYNVRSFIKYSSENYGMPKHYSKNRFNGKTFVDAYCDKFGVDRNDLKYKKTDDHIDKLKEANLGNNWYYNDYLKQNKQSKVNPGTGWQKGRKKWD
jgi:hypothetical protein